MAARLTSTGIWRRERDKRSRQKKSPAEKAGLLFVDALPSDNLDNKPAR
jgi:hypothetical protein